MITRTPEIEAILDELIGIEGDFVDDPNDAGGATRWGVTERLARAHGYQGAMADLPRETAEIIMLREKFAKPGFDKVLLRSRELAAELFEIEVNLPPGRAGQFLQRALNALNDPDGDGKENYPALKLDGQIGAVTMKALDAFLNLRKSAGERCLLLLVNSQQAVYYIERVEIRAPSKKFIFGWTMARVKLP